MELNGNHYDDDALERLAQRDTPAAVIARAVLEEHGDNSPSIEDSSRQTAVRD